VEILIKNFYEIVNSLQVTKIVVTDVNTNTEIESSIPSINDFIISKLQENNMLYYS